MVLHTTELLLTKNQRKKKVNNGGVFTKTVLEAKPRDNTVYIYMSTYI